MSNNTNINLFTNNLKNFQNSTLAIEQQNQMLIFVSYSVLFAVGAAGNIFVLGALAKSGRKKSRVNLLMTHLALADVCVVFGVIPLEISWKYTNAWLAGNPMCKLMLVIRAFGLYLSSNILVCISIDRFFAVDFSLKQSAARKRSKRMLLSAWVMALACSLPQSFVFRVMKHPQVEEFEQCVSFDTFSHQQEVAYNVFCLAAMYLLPLFVISVCYVCIFIKIQKNSKSSNDKGSQDLCHKNSQLRRSGHNVLERARRRTLRMTVIIVTTFALCWLPYATMTMWYMIDRDSASNVSRLVQDLLFAMAVSNSCVNPLVYGSFTLNLGGSIRNCFKFCSKNSSNSDILGNTGSSSAKDRTKVLKTPLVFTNGKPPPSRSVHFELTPTLHRFPVTTRAS